MINSVDFIANCDRVQLVYYYKVNKSYGKLSRLNLLEFCYNFVQVSRSNISITSRCPKRYGYPFQLISYPLELFLSNECEHVADFRDNGPYVVFIVLTFFSFLVDFVVW